MSEEKKRKEIGTWQLYTYDYKTSKASLKNRKCPRCGKTMAKHQARERWACGSCGYTEYIDVDAKKRQG